MIEDDVAELHSALLGLAGRVPDAVLAEARLRLGGGDPAAAAEVVSGAGSADLPEIGWAFLPEPPGAGFLGAGAPALLDLTGLDLVGDGDRAAMRSLAEVPGAVALWRTWRVAPGQPIAPARIYVLEAEGAAPAATATVMRALAAAGEATPLVETYAPGDKLPAYTRSARSASALLWTAAEAAPLRVARVFDRSGGGEPRFAETHQRLDAPDAERVADYLDAGSPILATTGRMSDVVEPERGEVVPMSFRTDGRWIWTDTVAYYLRAYGLAPESDLLTHIRAAQLRGTPPGTDAVGEHRALAALFRSMAIVAAGTP